MLRISQSDHEYIIRRTVADQASQQRLLAMHAEPIDVERVLRHREFETYKRSLVQAHADGKVTKDESDLLRTQREGLGITDADHEAMMAELIDSGEILLSGPSPRRKDIAAEAYIAPGGPTAASAPPLPPAIPPPEPSEAQPPAPGPVAPPAPGATPLPSRPTLYAGPAEKRPAEPGPAGPVSLLSSDIARQAPPAAPPGSPKEPLKLVKCTKCGETIPVFTEDRPLELVCPRCGFKGMLRK